MLASRPSRAGDNIDDPRRNAGLAHQLADPERAQRSELRRLEDDGVARGEGRAHLPAAEHQWEIPRDDRSNDTEGLADDIVEETRFHRDDIALQLVGYPAEIAKCGGRPDDVEVTAVANRMTGVQALEPGQLVGVRLNQIGQSEEDPAAGRRPEGRPSGEGRRRRRHRSVDVNLARSCDATNEGAVMRVDRFERRPVERVDEFPADEQAITNPGSGRIVGQRHRWLHGPVQRVRPVRLVRCFPRPVRARPARMAVGRSKSGSAIRDRRSPRRAASPASAHSPGAECRPASLPRRPPAS